MIRTIFAISLVLVLVVLNVMPVQGGVSATYKTGILFGGEEVSELIGFTYKVYKDRQDVIGNYGLLRVRGKILVHSNSELLNGYFDDDISFQIVLSKIQSLHLKEAGNQRFTLHSCQLDTIDNLVNNSTDEVDFHIYSFSCDVISGILPTDCGMITPGSLNKWELDSSGQSTDTLIMVTEGIEVTEIVIDDVSFEDAIAYQLNSHNYSITDYTFTADRIRED